MPFPISYVTDRGIIAPLSLPAPAAARAVEPKSPYAPKTEEDDGNPLKQANDSLAQRRLALSNKAKRAYAQFAA